MLKFHGPQPIAALPDLHPKGECPWCAAGTRFTLSTRLSPGAHRAGIKTFIASYACDLCLGPIGIEWTVNSWSREDVPLVRDPRLVTPLGLTFETGAAPAAVRAPLSEALDCFRSGAFNGFAFLSWRVVEAMADDAVGAGSPVTITSRVDDALGLLGLAESWKSLLHRILLPTAERPRADIPEMSREKAAVLLSVLRDLVHELYLRPVRLKEAVRGARSLIRETRRSQRTSDLDAPAREDLIAID